MKQKDSKLSTEMDRKQKEKQREGIVNLHRLHQLFARAYAEYFSTFLEITTLFIL